MGTQSLYILLQEQLKGTHKKFDTLINGNFF